MKVNVEIYLHIGEIYMVFFKEAEEFLEIGFCGVIMTTVRPNCLDKIKMVKYYKLPLNILIEPKLNVRKFKFGWLPE